MTEQEHHLEETISSYIDDELSPQERAEVDSHLKTCAHCAWHLRTLRQTVAMVKELPTVPVPRPFTIQAAPPGGFWLWFRFPQLDLYLKGATTLVALLLILMVAGEVVWQAVSFGRPPTTSMVAVMPQQEAPPSPTGEREEALRMAPSPAEEEAQEGAQEGAHDEAAAEPEAESPPPPEVSTPGYEPAKEGVAPTPPVAVEAPDEDTVPARRPEEPPAAAVEIFPPMPGAASQPVPSLTATPSPVLTPTATVLSSTLVPSPTLTSTVVAQVRSPTPAPEEAKTTEGARPQPASAWLTPWRWVQLVLLWLLIILIALTLFAGRYRTIS